MKSITVHYTLRDGTIGRLQMIARTSCDAVLEAIGLLGEDLAKLQARRAGGAA